MTRYKQMRLLGEGSFGRVILVEYAAYNQEFAAEKKTDHYSTMWANKTVY